MINMMLTVSKNHKMADGDDLFSNEESIFSQ